jgi:hypothetical protein
VLARVRGHVAPGLLLESQLEHRVALDVCRVGAHQVVVRRVIHPSDGLREVLGPTAAALGELLAQNLLYSADARVYHGQRIRVSG